MNSNPRPVSHAALKRALEESINILKSCADTLHYVDDPKLEKHTMAVTYCYQNCKRALAILENNPEELHAFASFFVMSCKKCVARCKQIDLDIFRKAVIALEDCIGEF